LCIVYLLYIGVCGPEIRRGNRRIELVSMVIPVDSWIAATFPDLTVIYLLVVGGLVDSSHIVLVLVASPQVVGQRPHCPDVTDLQNGLVDSGHGVMTFMALTSG
jgi:hypothetical protein